MYGTYIRTNKINDRIVTVGISYSIEFIFLINDYMPFDGRDYDSLDEYLSFLNDLNILLSEMMATSRILCGNFNADDFRNSRFWRLLMNLIENLNQKHASIFSLDQFSYLCPSSSSTSMLDHVFCSNDIIKSLTNFEILYHLALFDQFPLSFELDIVLGHQDVNSLNSNTCNSEYIDWKKISKGDIDTYQANMRGYLSNNQPFRFEALNCDRAYCNDKKHLLDLDSIYYIILFILINASNFLKNVKHKPKYRKVPGWNLNVKKYYENARSKFFCWKELGKPTGTIEHDEMKDSRNTFKKAFKECCKNENIKNTNIMELYLQYRE